MYNKTYRHDMIEIVLKVMLNTVNQTKRDICSKKKKFLLEKFRNFIHFFTIKTKHL